MEKSLVYIPVEKIYPHPDNPRKDLGDLTELAESVKANGILQNLTVVAGHRLTDDEWQALSKQYSKNPTEEVRRLMNGKMSPDGYTVIIGHRRLAAAKLAGLSEVPCVITEMDAQQQIRTMLTENLQRSDLTVYEQAQGFQMMLDMGETVESIAEKAGFSATTVRRRAKLLALDPKEFKKSEERGATLFDYMELDKVDDPKEKNKLLKVIGTPDFKAKLAKTLADQKKAERIAYIEETISTFAKKVKETNNEWKYISGPDYWSDKPIEIPEDAGTREYAFVMRSWGCSLYRKKDKAELDAEADSEARRQELMAKAKARKAEVEEVSGRCLQLRREFVFNLSATSCKKLMPVAMAGLLTTCTLYGAKIECEGLSALCPSLAMDDNFDPDNLTVDQIINAIGNSEQTLVRLAYLSAEPGDGYNRDWGEYEHAENEQLDMCYSFLAKLGYEMSEEEKAFQDGTHEIFHKNGEATEG